MISYKHRCIFVHIPKTGGSSIEGMIWPDVVEDREKKQLTNLWHGFTGPYWKCRNAYQTGGLQHLFAKHIKEIVGDKVFKTFFKFTMVRNPWDRAVSQYAYMMERRGSLQSFLGINSENGSFKKYLDLIQDKTHVQWEPQYKFIYDDNGKCLVNFIGRFEFFDLSFKTIVNSLNALFFEELKWRKKKGHTINDSDIANVGQTKSVGVPCLNVSTRKPYQEYYDDESKELVAELYKKDIELFNYTFERQDGGSNEEQDGCYSGRV